MSLQDIWEAKYEAGHAQRWPWDAVVSFVFRHRPRAHPVGATRVCEIGFGTGSNLWFAAREGFEVLGIEGSSAAVTAARERFAAEGLQAGDLRQGDFTAPLPWPAAHVHLAIDRGSLTCVDLRAAREVMGELHRVLVPGGRMLLNVYSTRHSSYRSGRTDPDTRLTTAITAGTMVGVGDICFYSESMLDHLLGGAPWTVLSREHLELQDLRHPEFTTHAEWRLVLSSPGSDEVKSR